MYLWKFTRTPGGLGELTGAIVAADTETEARVALVREYRNEDSVHDFLFDEYSSVTAIGEAVSGTEHGTVLMTSRSAG